MRTRWLAPLALLLGLAAPGAAQQPQRECNLVRSGAFENGPEIATFFDPFAFVCTDGTELSALRGTFNKLTRELHLVGDVNYKDPTRTLTAQDAVYNNDIGRLYATGNVVFSDVTQGMTLRGPEVEYYKAMPPGRPQAQVNAGQRPHLTLVPKKTQPGGAAPAGGNAGNEQPLEIDGDRMTLVGENDLSVFGNVLIQRPDLRATAGEARYSGTTEGLELRQNAEIQSEEYTLRGQVVQARLPGGELEHVESHTGAFLQGKDLTVTSDELQMFFEAGALQRTVARGGGQGTGRPLAVSKTFRLQADSLDALMPGQQLRQVVAIGNARGESVDTTVADTTRAAVAARDTTARDTAAVPAAPALADSDWIVGDTITGHFVMVPDTARKAAPTGPPAPGTAKSDSTVELQSILARGSALSLYRIEENRSTTAAAQGAQPPQRKGINFLSGEEIELTFAAGELKEADVRGLEKGIYLDPTRPTRPAPAGGGTTQPAPTPPAPPGGNG